VTNSRTGIDTVKLLRGKKYKITCTGNEGIWGVEVWIFCLNWKEVTVE